MDVKIKMLVLVIIGVTFLSIGISYLQYVSAGTVLANMSVKP